jgi:hypothetical protein
MRSVRVSGISSHALQSNQNVDIRTYTRHVQTGGGRRSGTLSIAELRTDSEKQNLNFSAVQHRTHVLTIYQGA